MLLALVVLFLLKWLNLRFDGLALLILLPRRLERSDAILEARVHLAFIDDHLLLGFTHLELVSVDFFGLIKDFSLADRALDCWLVKFITLGESVFEDGRKIGICFLIQQALVYLRIFLLRILVSYNRVPFEVSESR